MARGPQGTWIRTFCLAVSALSFESALLLAEPPEAVSRRLHYSPGQTELFIDLLAGASDVDGDPLSCSVASPPQGLTDGPAPCTFRLVPPSNTTFSYTVSDGQSAVTRTVWISDGLTIVTLPSISGLVAAALGPASFNICWTDDASPGSRELRGGPTPADAESRLLVTLSPPELPGAACWRYDLASTPPANTEYFFRLWTCSEGSCAFTNLASARTTPTSGNGAPQPIPDSGCIQTPNGSSWWCFRTNYGRALYIPFDHLLSNDTDPDGDPLSIVPLTSRLSTAKGFVEAAPGGFVYYANRSSATTSTTDGFEYTVTDGAHAVSGSSTRVTIDIDPETPVGANPDTFVALQEGAARYIYYSELTENDVGSPIRIRPLAFSRPARGRIDFCCHPYADGPDSTAQPTNLTNAPLGFWYIAPEIAAGGDLSPDEFFYTIFNGSSYDSAKVTLEFDAGSVGSDAIVARQDSMLAPLTGSSPYRSLVTLSDFLRGTLMASPGTASPDLGDRPKVELNLTTASGSPAVTYSWLTPEANPGPGSYLKDDLREGAVWLSVTSPNANTYPINYRIKEQLSSETSQATFHLLTRKANSTDFDADLQLSGIQRLRAVNDLVLEIPEGKRTGSVLYPAILWSNLVSNDLLPLGSPNECADGINNDPPIAGQTVPTRDLLIDAADPECAHHNSSSESGLPWYCKDGTCVDLGFLGRPYRGEIEQLGHWGGFHYRAPRNYIGMDHFTYVIRDPQGRMSAARAIVSVVRGRPDPNVDRWQTVGGVPVSGDALMNDTEPDGDPFRIIAVTQPSIGFAYLDAGGRIISYAPPLDFVGQARIDYVVQDSDGNNAWGKVLVDVSAPPVNQLPIAVSDEAEIIAPSAGQASEVVIDVLANDSDPDPGDSLHIVAVTQPQEGAVEIAGDSTVRYILKEPAILRPFVTFQYTVADPSGATGSAEVKVYWRPPSCRYCDQ